LLPHHRTSRIIPFLVLLVLLGATAALAQTPGIIAMQGERNFITGYPTFEGGDTVNIVVEIPAGSDQKWEVREPGKVMEWELKKGKRRVVAYLAYPANYGMIPQTMLPEEEGGDGDPLDVVLLGESVPRGSVTIGYPVAVLKLKDGGEQDDKIIAAPLTGPLSGVTGLEDLRTRFPGITDILETWFGNYKGPGVMKVEGWADRDEALAVVQAAHNAYTAIEASR